MSKVFSTVDWSPFDGQKIITALLVKDLPHGVLLGRQRIGQHQLAVQVLVTQQLAGGGDFIAPRLGHHTAQEASLGIDRVDDRHARVPDLLAVHDDDAILGRAEDLCLPAQEQSLQLVVIHRMQHTGEGGLLGTADRDRVQQLQHSCNEIELFDAQGNVAVTHPSRTTLRWIYRNEMELLLRLAGFARWQLLGGFDGRPLLHETDEMIVQAWLEAAGVAS